MWRIGKVFMTFFKRRVSNYLVLRQYTLILMFACAILTVFISLNISKINKSVRSMEGTRYLLLLNQKNYDHLVGMQLNIYSDIKSIAANNNADTRRWDAQQSRMTQTHWQILNNYDEGLLLLDRLFFEAVNKEDARQFRLLNFNKRELHRSYMAFKFNLGRLINLNALGKSKAVLKAFSDTSAIVKNFDTQRNTWSNLSHRVWQKAIQDTQRSGRNNSIFLVVNFLFLLVLFCGIFILRGLVLDLNEKDEEIISGQKQLALSHKKIEGFPAKLLAANEKDRNKVASLIHDELGHLITSIKFNLHSIKASVNSNSPRLELLFNQSQEVLNESNKVLKNLLTDLKPSLVARYGFKVSLGLLVEKFESSSGIKSQISYELDSEAGLSNDFETHIYRVVQEGLTNILKHAKATSVIVTLKKKGPEIELRVFDNGQGLIKKDLKKNQCFGLEGMRDRIHSLKGDFKIDSVKKARGTLLKIRIPVGETK
jgi:signal transduction histidine kinase